MTDFAAAIAAADALVDQLQGVVEDARFVPRFFDTVFGLRTALGSARDRLAAAPVAGDQPVYATVQDRSEQAVAIGAALTPNDEAVARYAAVEVDRVKILTYMLLGICVGIATLIYVPRLGSASPTTGLLWELEAIAAVIVGGAALKGGSGTVIGTVVGAILLSVISNILNLTSIISVYLNAAVQGFVIIIVAFLQRGRR